MVVGSFLAGAEARGGVVVVGLCRGVLEEY